MNHRTLTLTALIATLTPAASAATLVDCSKDARNVHCARPADLAQSAGTLGSGPAFYQGGSTDDVTGGFVTADGRTFIGAIETLSDTDAFGAIIAVDLNTGDRRLISGRLNQLEQRGRGVMSALDYGGSAELYDLGNIRDVQPLPNGDYAAINRDGVIIRVNGQTGDRTLLWRPALSSDTKIRDGAEAKYAGDRAPATTAGTASTPNLPTINTPLGSVNLGGLFAAATAPAPTPKAPAAPTYFCPPAVADSRPAAPLNHLSADAQGNLYLLGGNNPLGSGFALFKLDANDDYRCKAVTQFTNDGTNVLGSGPTWNGSSVMTTGPLFANLARNGDVLYAAGGPNPNYIVVGVNTRTGERSLVSGQRSGNGAQVYKRGSGEALIGSALTFSGGNLYTTQEQVTADAFTLVRINPATGDRTVITPAKGSSLAVAGSASDSALFAIPGSPLLLVWFADGLHLLDPATGMSNLLSR
ncbi:hypothetical protein [Deinococcus maricopensis]|uniref:hypothetical protein n=1 Tax=Deinococcus maricopensis TaxID=309887 RepID=UPI000316811C|nr:hypothetical protein [Deinococcus maricopensis]